jgi:hypothetical protein
MGLCSKERSLVLDDDEVVLRVGDVIVQRGTDHAWANRGSGVCRVAFILIDGQFAPDLIEVLPSGTSERMMRHGH